MRRDNKTLKQIAESLGCSQRSAGRQFHAILTNDPKLAQEFNMDWDYQPWTTEEDATLISELAKGKTLFEAANAVPHRTTSACYSRHHYLVQKMVTKKRHDPAPWLSTEDDRLRSLNEQGCSREQMSKMIQRSPSGIDYRMERLGLRLKFTRRPRIWSDEENKIVVRGVEMQLTLAHIQALLPDRSYRMVDWKIRRTKKEQGIRARSERKWTVGETAQLKKACTSIMLPARPPVYAGHAELFTIENIASKMSRTRASVQYKLDSIRKRPELVQNSDLGITSASSSLSKRAFSSQAKQFAHKEGGVLVQEAQTTDPKGKASARPPSKRTPEKVNQLTEMRKQRLPFVEIAFPCICP